MNPNTHICSLNLSGGGALGADAAQAEAAAPPCPTRQRLAEAFAILEKIQVDRLCQEEVALGRLVEDRIVWRELIELELQDADERIERISTVAGFMAALKQRI